MFLKKIKDIRISNNRISIIRDAEISIADLEFQISQLNYSGTGNSKDLVVESAKLPPFIQVFYYLFFQGLKVPSENLLFETYVQWLGGIHDEKIKFNDIEYNAIGIQNRLKRTYPSLIRDVHFLYLLEQSNRFENVEYSMEIDYYNGLDLKVSYKGKEVFVSIFIDTSRSTFYKRKKMTRHDYSIFDELEFNVDFDGLTKVGNIYLLNHSHVDLLEERIKNNNY